MATLTETAYYSRKIVKYGLVGLVSLVIARGLFSLSIKVYQQIFPPPPPPPTVRYGKLPKLPLESVGDLPETVTYRLETPDGTTNLEEFRSTRLSAPDQMKVYFAPASNPNLLGLERAKERAAALGFRDEPEFLENSIYRFKDVSGFITLDVHATTLTFHLTYAWQGNQNILGNPPASNEEAFNSLKTFLSASNTLSDELLEGKIKYRYLRANGSTLSEVNSLSDADFVRVDVFRKDLEGFDSFTSTPQEAPVWAIVSGASSTAGKVVEVSYRYFGIEREEFSTYPIKSSMTAWEELGSGKGYVVALGDNKDGNIVVRRVHLGYYDSTVSPLRFMQPIYVFGGDRGFVGYVPAVTPEWTQ